MNVASKLSIFFAELKRRKVYRVAVVYVVVGLGILGAAEVTLDPLGLEALRPYIVILVLLGFPIALVLAWAYEVKPEEPRDADKAPGPAIDISEAEHRKSIVVLPFDNMSPDPNDAYFADGLTEEITTHLSCCGVLRVISRNSAMVLKDTRKDTRTIGRELDVQCVLEGSVRRAGDDLRITAQLIDAGTDTHLWAETYEGTLQDVFDIQEKVARSIVEALQLELGPEEDRRLTERPIENLQAYECYLRARQEAWRFAREPLERAVAYLERAHEIVGDNALIFSGLSYVYSQYVNIGLGHEEATEKAEVYARNALELDPDLPQAHLVLGFMYLAARGDPEKSICHLERCIDRTPDDSHALLWLVAAYSIVGLGERIPELAQRAVDVDPLTPMVRMSLAFPPWMEGRYDLALEKTMEWYERDSENSAAVMFAALFLAWAGRGEEAGALIANEVPKDSEESFSRFSLFLKAAIDGDQTSMGSMLAGSFRENMRRDAQFAYCVASTFALADMKAEAVEWVRHAVDGGFLNYPWLADHDPFLTRYRDDPEYRAILGEVEERLARRRQRA